MGILDLAQWMWDSGCKLHCTIKKSVIAYWSSWESGVVIDDQAVCLEDQLLADVLGLRL